MLAILKKDLILARKGLIFELFFCLVIIPFLSYKMNMGELGGVIICFLIQMIVIITTSTAISTKEVSNPKALTYLCSLPYKRKVFVLEKYLLDIILIIACNVIFAIESLFFPVVNTVSIIPTFVLIWIVLLYRAIIIPLEFKFGFEKVKFYSVFAIFVIAFGVPALLNKVEIKSPEWINSIPSPIQAVIMLVLIVLTVLISGKVSCNIFERKEL